jgi:predicted glycosyltransferase
MTDIHTDRVNLLHGSQPQRPVVLFQVPNSVGLGHMNRMACVALALRELAPMVRFLFVVEGSSHGLLEALNIPHITIPHAKELYRARGWSAWPTADRRELLKTIAASILETTEPSIVIYDCFPNLEFAECVSAKGIKSMLCIRKVKNSALYVQIPTVRRVLDSGASILIPHGEGEFCLPMELAARATYVGEIVRPLPIDPRPVQLKFNLPGKQIVVISGGGGGHSDTVHHFNLCLRAFGRLRESRKNIIGLLITGPLYANWSSLELVDGLRVIPFDPDFTATCATADLVLCQAGYNSINELAALGTPAICIPARRGFDDQFERARHIESSFEHIVCFEGDSWEQLAELMNRRLDQTSPRRRSATPDGAYRAAFHILTRLNEQ